MITIKEFKQPFESKEVALAALKANKAELIGLKKAAVKRSDPVMYHPRPTTIKAEGTAELQYGDFIYPVINTTNYLDSHEDVHIDGIWNKSIKDTAGNIYYVVNHDLALGSVISYPKEVEAMVRKMYWGELGKDLAGETEALIFKAKLTEKSQKDAFLAFKDREAIQNSIRMQYVTMELAINSASDDYAEEKAAFDKYVSRIANKEKAIEQGYFWAITEAKIYKEGSAVLFGSNDATPVLYGMKDTAIQPPGSTEKEPSAFNIKSLLNCF